MSAIQQPKHLLSEDEVKEMLGIQDFRHMSKRAVVECISSLPLMDPAVAEKVLEQFPEMCNVAFNAVKEYRASFEKALDANDESSKATLANIDSLISVYQKELDRDDITPEERAVVYSNLSKLSESNCEIHKENQRFISNQTMLAAFVTVGVVIGVASVLGGNGKIQLPNIRGIIPKA